MKRLLYLCAALLLTLSAVPALAANITGTWSSEMKTPDGMFIDANIHADIYSNQFLEHGECK